MHSAYAALIMGIHQRPQCEVSSKERSDRHGCSAQISRSGHGRTGHGRTGHGRTGHGRTGFQKVDPFRFLRIRGDLDFRNCKLGMLSIALSYVWMLHASVASILGVHCPCYDSNLVWFQEWLDKFSQLQGFLAFEHFSPSFWAPQTTQFLPMRDFQVPIIIHEYLCVLCCYLSPYR